MKHFAIMNNLELNWRMVAPHDYGTLEIFLTPYLSLWLEEITNGKESFVIGSYMMQAATEQKKFNNEVLPRRSDERIKQAFKNEDVSVFFGEEEAEELQKLFEKEGFFAKKVSVLYYGRPIDVRELSEEDFEIALDAFRDYNVMAMMEFEKQWESYDNMLDEAREEVKKGMRHREWQRQKNDGFITKKSLLWRGILTITGFLITGFTRMFVHNQLGKMMGGMHVGWKKKVAIGLLHAVPAIIGNFSKVLAQSTFERFMKGVVRDNG